MEQEMRPSQRHEESKSADNDIARSDVRHPCPVCAGNREVCKFTPNWPVCPKFMMLTVY